MTTAQEIELLKAQIKDRDKTIEYFLMHQAAPTYAKGYSAGKSSAIRVCEWHYRERERLKALCKMRGIDWMEGAE